MSVQCRSKYDCMIKSSRCNSHVYCLATQLCYIFSCSISSKLACQAFPLRLSSVHNVASYRSSHRNRILFLLPPLRSSVRLQICSVYVTSRLPPLFSISIVPSGEVAGGGRGDNCPPSGPYKGGGKMAIGAASRQANRLEDCTDVTRIVCCLHVVTYLTSHVQVAINMYHVSV